MAKQDQETVWSDFRVGIVTLAALILLILGITFSGGDKGLFLQKSSMVKALLANVGGLKKGSSVTMGGMTVGKVSGIAFMGSSETTQIEVTMQVRNDVRPRIKSDSVPSVRTQGMLGDRYVDISVGAKDADPLPDGKPLIEKSATDFDETLHQALDVLTETEKLLSAINHQQGTVGQLFYDQRFYENLVRVTGELSDLIQDVKKQPKKYVKLSLF